jgi:hypothetical protein
MFMHVRRVAECGRDGGLHRGRAAARAQQRRPRLRLRPHRGQGRSLRVGVDRGRRRHRLRDRGLRRRHPAEGPDDHASWASRWGSRSGRRSRHTRLPWLTLRTVATAPSNLQGQRELVGSRLQRMFAFLRRCAATTSLLENWLCSFRISYLFANL